MRIGTMVLVVALGMGLSLFSPAADFNGDGSDDIGVFRPDTGLWAVRNITKAYFGQGGDVPVPGKYRAGGRDRIAIYRASSSLWAVQGVTRIYFGAGTDMPLAGGSNPWIWKDINEIYFDGAIGLAGCVDPARAIHVGDGAIRVDRSTDAAGLWLHRYSGETPYKTFELGVDASASNNGSFFISDHGSAVSGTGTKRLVIDNTGDVGIGTETPGWKLHVEQSQTGGVISYIYNPDTGSNADGLAIGFGTATPGANNIYINFAKSALLQAGSITGNGTGGVAYNTGGSDFAEWLLKLKVEEEIEAGDIVGVINGMITRETGKADYVQVVSTAPGWVGNCPGEDKEPLYEKVAFLGQAPVKVNGMVRAGDYIVPSGHNDGTGMAVSPADLTPEQAAQIVGVAREQSSVEGLKTVNTVVGVQISGQALCHLNQEKDREIARLRESLSTMEERIARLEKAGR